MPGYIGHPSAPPERATAAQDVEVDPMRRVLTVMALAAVTAIAPSFGPAVIAAAEPAVPVGHDVSTGRIAGPDTSRAGP